jgi:hypothetical protein
MYIDTTLGGTEKVNVGLPENIYERVVNVEGNMWTNFVRSSKIALMAF